MTDQRPHILEVILGSRRFLYRYSSEHNARLAAHAFTIFPAYHVRLFPA